MKPLAVVLTSLATWLPVHASGSPAVTTVSTVADWAQYRGPMQNGAAQAPGLFSDGPIRLELAWKRPLGSGYSGVSVAGDYTVTMFSDAQRDVLVALETETGRERWRRPIAATYRGHYGSHDGPLSTPAISGETVFALGPRGHLLAVRLRDAQQIWSLRLEGELAREPFYGFVTSPFVVRDLVIVQTGGAGRRAVTAFDTATGDIRWSNGVASVTYQSPLLTSLGGRQHLVALTDHLLIGLDPATGEELWQHKHGADPYEAFGQPVELGDDRLFLNSMREVVALRVRPDDAASPVKQLWRSRVLHKWHVLPVVHEGYVYSSSTWGLSCIEAASGRLVWRSRSPGGRGLVLVDGHLVILARDGVLVVVEATAEGYREKAQLPALSGDSYTAPSFADGRVFVRDLQDIACLRVLPAGIHSRGPPGP